MTNALPQTIAYCLSADSTLIDHFRKQPSHHTFINATAYKDNLLQMLCQLVPNVLLVEPEPDCPERSAELIRRVRMWPKLAVKCVVLLPVGANWLSVFDELDISGKLSLSRAKEELANCLNTMAEGYRFLSPQLQKSVTQLKTACSAKFGNRLTNREHQVVKLVAKGYSNKEIAEQLFVSVKTVEVHKFNVIQKLELSSTGELRQWARQQEGNKEITLYDLTQN